METSAGNTIEDIDFQRKEGGGECVPNLRGASPVGRDGGGQSYAARAEAEELDWRYRGRRRPHGVRYCVR